MLQTNLYNSYRTMLELVMKQRNMDINVFLVLNMKKQERAFAEREWINSGFQVEFKWNIRETSCKKIFKCYII